MKNKNIIFILVILALFFSSCQKDLDQFVPDPSTGPDDTWYNVIDNSMPVSSLRNDLLLNMHRDSVMLNSSTVTFSSASGLQFAFPSGALRTPNGLPATGRVFLETLLLKKKGDIIRMGVPTTSNGRLLVTGGAFFIRLVSNGDELRVAQNQNIVVRYNEAQPSPLMKKFDGIESAPGYFNWLPNNDTLFNTVNVLNQQYQVNTNTLRWINCDYFYDTTGQARTTVSAVLPYYYTNANTVAFTVFNEMRSVVGMYGNATTRKFATGLLPVNKPVTVVVISKQGNDYFLGHEQAMTTGIPGTVSNQQVTVNPVITTLDNIKNYLNSLQ